MPTRMLRDGILTSERVDALTAPQEVFYRRLMSVVDDYGRFHAHHSLIRAACYPLKLATVSDSDVGKLLTGCVSAGLVRVYPAKDGKRYLELLDFGQRIQAKSKFPDPPSFVQDSPCSTVDNGEPPEPTVLNRLVVVEDVVEVEGVSPAKKPAGRTRKTTIPEGFALSDRVKAWAAEKGYSRLEQHLEAFVSKAKAKAYTYADWDEAFMEAVRKDWAGLGAGGTTGSTRKRRQL